MRIGILALLHESNTFLGQPTGLDRFRENMLLVGGAVVEHLADTHHEVGGFFAGLRQAAAGGKACQAVPLFAARAVPSGTITAAAFDELLETMFRQLDAALPLDGILAAPHGATVSAAHPDADGYWLSQLRSRLGDDVPIVATLDAHANLSARMVSSCNALVAYRSNPHLDQRARGMEAANLLVRTLAGEIRPTMAAAFPPLAINIERQLTSEPQCRGLYQLADRQLAEPGVLSNSILLGFPYADVAEMGSSLVVVTNDDPAAAGRRVGELADYLWTHRADFVGQLVEVEEALDQVQQVDGPVCLLDMGDNVGGGSPGDGTVLIQALHRRRQGPSFACLYDPSAVQSAAAAGAGGRVRLGVGGKSDQLHGPPLEAEFRVLGLYDGTFVEPEVRHGGFTHCDQGPTAVVRSEHGLTLMLTSRRMPPFSLRQLTSFDVQPADFAVLVAKGVNAPVAAYEPVCRRLLRVNTPGVTTADMCRLNFLHRRRPLFPFEQDFTWEADVGALGHGVP